MTKEDIRRQTLEIRRTLSYEENTKKSEIIIDKLKMTSEYISYDSIYTYVGFDGEVSTRLFIETALLEGKKIACPKVTNGEMKFYYITQIDDLKPGHFGVLEPTTDIIAEAKKALIIMPGIAFDLERNRVGYGKGYYDKYLEKHTLYATIALAFDFQITESIESKPFDIKPQLLITETSQYAGTALQK